MKVCNNAAHNSKSISHLPKRVHHFEIKLFTILIKKILQIGGGSTTTDPHSLNDDIKFG